MRFISGHSSRRYAHGWREEDRGYETPCWIWQGALTPGGYGNGGRRGRAHRIAWIAKYGPIPKGLYVLHRCDVPACVNPAHLFLGTPAENMADRDRKGRQARGETSAWAKLTHSDVRYIRANPDGLSHRALAKRFGVSHPAIRNVIVGRTWKHVS